MKTISLALSMDEVDMLNSWLGQLSDGCGENKGDIRGCMNPKRTPDGDDFQGDIYIRLHRDWSLLKVKR